MSYPLIIAPNGEQIARINFDGKWSVRWERVLHWAYEKPTKLNGAVIACSRMLLAARDNFVVAPWSESDQANDRWDHFQAEIGFAERPIGDDECHFLVCNEDERVARVNPDGIWAINWSAVGEIARLAADDWRFVALVGFCSVLMAAKDNFLTAPWDQDDDDEDEF